MGLLAKEVLPTEPVETGGPARESNFLVSTFNFVTRLPSGVLKRLSDDDANSATNSGSNPTRAEKESNESKKEKEKKEAGKREVSKSESGTGGTNKRRGGFLSNFVKIPTAILSKSKDEEGHGNANEPAAAVIKRSNTESTALERLRQQRQEAEDRKNENEENENEDGGGGDAPASGHRSDAGVKKPKNFVVHFGALLWTQLDVNKDGNVSLAQWKEVMRKRIRYVESLGLLGDCTGVAETQVQERRAKKVLTLGHSSWDTVLHILLCIRRAMEEAPPLADGANDSPVDQKESLLSGLGSSATTLISSTLSQSSDKETSPPPQFLLRPRFRLLESQGTCESGWTGQDFAPAVFRQLRDSFGIQPDEYRVSLGPERLFASLLTGSLSALEEIVSSGRSGSFLYRSMDGRYLIKTLPPEEKSFYRHILPSYFDHMTKNPNSLLTRFCGLHKISGNKGRATSFVVMENVIHTDKPIHEQYDLKGSTVNRSVRLGEKDEMGSVAQKDNDFQRKLRLGPLAQTFVHQIESDCKWLESHGICDYSLLVGIHSPRQKGDKKDASTDDKSATPTSSSTLSSLSSVFKQYHGGVPSALPTASGVGGGEVYWLGLIDILTTYSFKKKSEHTIKSIFHDSTQISAIPPGPYRERFVTYVRSIVE